MIPTFKSAHFLEEIEGTWNRPVKAICRVPNVYEIYYLKYARNRNEIDGLLSEILCQRLARHLHLNSPDIALVEIGDHPIDPDKISYPQHLQIGQVVFGSRRLSKADELPKSWKINDKTIEYINRFLTSRKRITAIESDVSDYITYLPTK